MRDLWTFLELCDPAKLDFSGLPTSVKVDYLQGVVGEAPLASALVIGALLRSGDISAINDDERVSNAVQYVVIALGIGEVSKAIELGGGEYRITDAIREAGLRPTSGRNG